MKIKSVTLLILSAASLLRITTAQEAVPLEEAQKAARKVNAALPTLTGAPLSIDADLDKPHLVKGGNGGVMVIPDKKFTDVALANAGTAITPVGQLWMLKIGIACDGKPIPADELRSVTITDNDKERAVQASPPNASGSSNCTNTVAPQPSFVLAFMIELMRDVSTS